MKKIFIPVAFFAALTVFTQCGPSKKTASAPAAKMTYEGNMQEVITTNCSPCHIPAKGGNKKAYDNYTNVKTDIDEIIRRIELNPGEKGFMPFKKTAKLSDSTIQLFKQWRADGLPEK